MVFSSGFNGNLVVIGNSLSFPFYTDCIIIVRPKRRPDMLLMGTMGWIIIGVAVAVLAVFIGLKIKDRYF
jgi:hypothetical protein